MLFVIIGAITYVRLQWAKFHKYCLKDSWALYWTRIAIYNISQSLTSHKLLPPYNHWSLYYYKKAPELPPTTHSPKLTEMVFAMERNEIPTPEHFAGLLNVPCPMSQYKEPNALVLCHCEPHIYSFVSPPKSVSADTVSRQFLSILYSHPKMKSSIPIELDIGIYLVGNEILSAAFVERYLMYQSRPYIFDANYKLEMMNNRIQMFEMNSSQYVVLVKAGYVISHVKPVRLA